jgi:hypothetical protein
MSATVQPFTPYKQYSVSETTLARVRDESGTSPTLRGFRLV